MKKPIDNRRIGFHVEIGESEREMLNVLKKNHSVNLSQLARNFIRKTYLEMTGKSEVNHG